MRHSTLLFCLPKIWLLLACAMTSCLTPEKCMLILSKAKIKNISLQSQIQIMCLEKNMWQLLQYFEMNLFGNKVYMVWGIVCYRLKERYPQRIASYCPLSLLSLLIIFDVIIFIITSSHVVIIMSAKSEQSSQFLIITSFYDSFEDYLLSCMMLILLINNTYLASTEVCFWYVILEATWLTEGKTWNVWTTSTYWNWSDAFLTLGQ